MLGHIQQIGQGIPEQARTLSGGAQRQFPRTGLIVGQAAPVFHTHGGVSPKPEPVTYSHRGAGKRGIHVASGKFTRQEDITPGFIVQHGRVRPGRVRCVGYGRQRVVFNAYPFKRVFGEIAVFRDNHSERFPDIAHLVNRQGREAGLFVLPHF